MGKGRAAGRVGSDFLSTIAGRVGSTFLRVGSGRVKEKWPVDNSVLAASVVREDRMLRKAWMWKYVNVNVTDTISWQGHHDRIMQLNWLYCRGICQMTPLKMWPNTSLGCNHQLTCMPQLRLLCSAALVYPMYYPGGIKARVIWRFALFHIHVRVKIDTQILYSCLKFDWLWTNVWSWTTNIFYLLLILCHHSESEKHIRIF